LDINMLELKYYLIQQLAKVRPYLLAVTGKVF